MLRHSTNRAKYGKTEFIHNMNLFDYRSLDIVFLSSLRIKDVGKKKKTGRQHLNYQKSLYAFYLFSDSSRIIKLVQSGNKQNLCLQCFVYATAHVKRGINQIIPSERRLCSLSMDTRCGQEFIWNDECIYSITQDSGKLQEHYNVVGDQYFQHLLFIIQE